MAVKTKATLLSEAAVIRDEITKNANTAARVGQHLYDAIDTSIPSTDTVFDDSGEITVNQTVLYSTVKTVQGATYALDIADTGHVIGNYIQVRYTFESDCNITISGAGYDSTGSVTGTITPITAGTYDVYFIASVFGVNVFIKNNAGQISLPTKLITPTLTLTADNASINYSIVNEDANATDGVLEYSSDGNTYTPVSGYTFAVKTGSITSLSNGELYYVRFKNTATGFSDSNYNTKTATPSAIPIPTFSIEDGAIDVNVATNIVVTFNDPIRALDGNAFDDSTVDSIITLKYTDENGADIVFDATINVGKTQVTVNPTGNLNSSSIIYLMVNNYEGNDGSEQLVGYSISFTTTLSSAASAVVTRLTGMTSQEQSAVIAFVDAEVAVGNWDLIDEFACFKLTGANALKGFKTKTFTNSGALKVTEGYQFIGSPSHIKTGFVPITDGVNYTLNVAFAGCYVKTQTANGYLWGVGQTAATRLAQHHSSSSSSGTGINGGGGFNSGLEVANTYVLLDRVAAGTNGYIYRNGVNAATMTFSQSASLNTLEIVIGGRNLNGTIQDYMQGILSAWVIGGGVLFNHSAHNTNVVNLLNALS